MLRCPPPSVSVTNCKWKTSIRAGVSKMGVGGCTVTFGWDDARAKET